jgi:hypothetical protein
MTEPPPLRARSSTPWVAASIAIVATLIGGYSVGVCRGPTVADQRAQNVEAALRIRISAKQTCEFGLYRDCLRMYDEAKRFDPQGDLDPDVQQARGDALAAIAAGRGPSPADARADHSAPRGP